MAEAGPSRAGAVHASFAPAGQPDLVRAAQKDEFYVQYLRTALLDVAQRLLGPRRTMALDEEVTLLSALLYYGLTTGAGTPTLGEEYCDLQLVAGEAQRPASAPRRSLLVALHAVLPYLLQREQRLAASAVASTPQLQAAEQEGGPGRAALCALRGAAWRARLRLRAALPYLAEPLALAGRLHLALFYLHGAYLAPSYRLAGVRRVFVGRLTEPRARYGILGVFLLAQVALQTARLARRARLAAPSAGVARHALLLDAEGRGTPLDPPLDGGSSEQPPPLPGAPVCALCLSPRRAPTATPCGHIFCWACAAEWCATKPECPLCRAPATPQELAPIYNMA